MQYAREYLSPLGKMLIASDEESLVWVCFFGQKCFPKGLGTEQSAECPKAASDILDCTCRWLDEYFAGRLPSFMPPVSLSRLAGATPFRMAVWQILLNIPYGKTMTYGEAAAAVRSNMGKARMAAQAVGQAVACNPVSIIIPCHRVVGAGGALVGYGGGLERKEKLLKMEREGTRL